MRRRNACKSIQGQSVLETLLTLSMIAIPLGTGIMVWAKIEFGKSESAFWGFQKARVRMIQLQKPITEKNITLYPLEDLDQNKGGLLPKAELNQVLQLWDFQFWQSP